MKTKIRVAQIGTGHDHAPMTFRSLRKLTEDFDVIGIAEPVEARLSRLQTGEYKNAPQYTVEQLLDMDLDAVAIETDEEYATEYAQLFADRGVAVHLDKPGSHGVASFEKLVKTLQAQKLPFHQGYMYRYNPLILRAFDEIAAGNLGEIYSVEAHMSVRHPIEKRQWLGKYKGGMLYWLGCHLIDLVYRIQGEPEKVHALSRPTGADGVESEDFGAALLEYKNGVSFVRTSMVEYGGFTRRQLVICGTGGTIELCPTEVSVPGGLKTYGRYTNFKNAGGNVNGWAEKWETDVFDRYDAMMADFAALVRGEKENEYSYEYEMALFRLVMQCCGYHE